MIFLKHYSLRERPVQVHSETEYYTEAVVPGVHKMGKGEYLQINKAILVNFLEKHYKSEAFLRYIYLCFVVADRTASFLREKK